MRGLARTLRDALLLKGALYTATAEKPSQIYDPMIKAFDNAGTTVVSTCWLPVDKMLTANSGQESPELRDVPGGHLSDIVRGILLCRR